MTESFSLNGDMTGVHVLGLLTLECVWSTRPSATRLQALTAAGVTFIVAPYEADAQMAYLAKRGLVDIVITEDSDLLVYGCPQVVFKLARTGECDHIKLEDMPLNRNPSFAGFSHENFIEVCTKR